MDQRSIAYSFLLSPRYKTGRYLAIFIFFTIVSLNQSLAGYSDVTARIGDKLYGIIAMTILVYIIGLYLVLNRFRNYLLSGKYMRFGAWVAGCSLLFMVIPNLVYIRYLDDYSLFSARTLIDNLSAFATYALCILGVIIPGFLNNWIQSNQRLNQLIIKQKISEVEQLKEQINPSSFFKILNKSRSLVTSEPDKASSMLMKLSQLLRYQLYDCNRPQVLLGAEITFLKNYLELEKLYSSTFDYTIQVEGNIDGVFIFPSILLPYVQSIINSQDNENSTPMIGILIVNTDSTVSVTLHARGVGKAVLLESELWKVKERLNTLYRENYILTRDQDADQLKVLLLLQKD